MTYISYMLLIIRTFCWDNCNIEGNVVWQPVFFFQFCDVAQVVIVYNYIWLAMFDEIQNIKI